MATLRSHRMKYGTPRISEFLFLCIPFSLASSLFFFLFKSCRTTSGSLLCYSMFFACYFSYCIGTLPKTGKVKGKGRKSATYVVLPLPDTSPVTITDQSAERRGSTRGAALASVKSREEGGSEGGGQRRAAETEGCSGDRTGRDTNSEDRCIATRQIALCFSFLSSFSIPKLEEAKLNSERERSDWNAKTEKLRQELEALQKAFLCRLFQDYFSPADVHISAVMKLWL